MVAGQMRYGISGFLYDVFYLDLSSANDIDRRLASGDIDVGFSQVMATLAGSYKLLETDNGHLDALAGWAMIGGI